jgi:hypothetical protein
MISQMLKLSLQSITLSFTIFLNLPVNRGKHCRPVIPYSKVIGVVRYA